MAITLLMFGLIYGTDLHKYRIPNYTDEELEQMRIERIVNMLMDTKSGTIIGYSFGNKEAHTWMVVSHNDTGKKVLYGHPLLTTGNDPERKLTYQQVIEFSQLEGIIYAVPEHQAEAAQKAADDVMIGFDRK